MLRKAELALAGGNFLKANRIRKGASGLMDTTLDLHRRFMKRMKKFLEKISDMEDRGYDVSEAMRIMEKAKDRAIKAEYERAMKTLKLVDPALDRAAYLPFPLLNKTVDIISTIFYSAGKVSYTVRIENPTNESLGEIIITPSFSEDEFNRVAEKQFGIVGPREYKEYTFYLTPKKKDWNLGVGREVLMEEGVMMRTKLSSKVGRAGYLVIVENNSDQIIRDVVVSPQTPGGLSSDPVQGIIEAIPPFSTGQVTFDLFPGIIDREGSGQTMEGSSDRVVVIEEEEPVGSSDNDFMISVREEEDEIVDDEEDEELSFDVDDISGGDPDEGPKDFTPVKEEYDLIEMAPNKIPEEVEKAMRRPVKKKRVRS
jgi:hypothetical protein